MPSTSRTFAIFTAALAIHLVALAAAATIDWNEDLRSRFLPDDPAIEGLRTEGELFGSGETILILVDWPGQAPPSLSADLRRWSRELGEIDGAAAARTLFETPWIIWTAPTAFEVTTAGSLDIDAQSLLDRRLVRKLYGRPDGRGTIVAVDVDPRTVVGQTARRRLVETLRSWSQSQGPDYRFTLAGTIPIEVAANAAAIRDAAVISPLLVAALLAFLATALGSMACAAAILAVAGLNVTATFGTAAILGWELSRFSLIGATIIIAVGVLDNIHLAYAYAQSSVHVRDGVRAMNEAVHKVRMPCFWTSITTAAGFSSLLMASIPQIRELGAICAVGALWAFVSTFTLLPALLGLTRPTPSRFAQAATQRLTEGFSKPIAVVLSITAAACAGLGLPRLSLVADFPRIFPSGHEITETMERIEADWGGSAAISFLITPRNDANDYDVAALDRLLDFERLLSERELVTSVVSILDIVRAGEESFRQAFGRTPTAAERDIIVDALRDEARLSNYLSGDGSTTRVVARVHMMTPQRFPALARDLDGFRENLADLFDVRLAGWPLLYKNLEARLLGELFSSFAVAFALVSVLMLVALRSIRMWMCAIIVNAVPLAIVLGGLGVTGAGLSTGILMAPGIALGLVVDDTIHYLTALERELNAQHPAPRRDLPKSAFARALDSSGAALLVTSLTLLCGFGLMMLSQFTGNRALGAVMAAIAALAWLADVTLLPLLLRRVLTTGVERPTS